MSTDADHSDALCEAVRLAFEAGECLRISGSGSKTFLTPGPEGAEGAPWGPLLSVAEHCGVLDYRPEELVVTARAGTSLKELERTLARAGQHLPFEPPRFRGSGTIGGAVACGLAGPGRAWRGGVRDALLGVELVNGRGERLRFGGQVMKNVAGYDVARLQAGAFGTLGLLLAVSLKVLPRAPAEETRVFALTATEALACCRSWARLPHPVTATCYLDGTLRVRLSGAASAVRQAATALGGEREPDEQFWNVLRDHRHEFFAAPGLWRCSVPPAAAQPLDDCLVTWGGAERWWRPSTTDGLGDSARPAAVVAEQGGHARPFDRTFAVRHGPQLTTAEHRYSARLKQAFDPGGVFNPELSIPGEAADAD